MKSLLLVALVACTSNDASVPADLVGTYTVTTSTCQQMTSLGDTITIERDDSGNLMVNGVPPSLTPDTAGGFTGTTSTASMFSDSEPEDCAGTSGVPCTVCALSFAQTHVQQTSGTTISLDITNEQAHSATFLSCTEADAVALAN